VIASAGVIKFVIPAGAKRGAGTHEHGLLRIGFDDNTRPDSVVFMGSGFASDARAPE
jgi:hypothetical protein